MTLSDLIQKSLWDETLHPRNTDPGFGRGRFVSRDARRAEARADRADAKGNVTGGRADTANAPPGWTVNQNQHSDVLVIGDSHTLFTMNGMNQTPTGAYPDYDVNAMAGRNAAGGVEMLTDLLKGRHETVVFDLATNDVTDPATFKKNLLAVIRATKGRNLVFVNSYREPWGDASPGAPNVADAVDAVLRQVANRLESGPRADAFQLVNWKKQAAAHPEWLLDDNAHYTADGYAARAAMIEKAVEKFR